MQLREMRLYAERHGWAIEREYVDTMSGARVDRPAFGELLQGAQEKRFDIVLVWKLDRFGRSLTHCLEELRNLERWGVRLIATTQGIDTDSSNPSSRFYLHLLAAAAEFERELLRERVKAGLARYREDHAKGQAHSRSGKNQAPGRPKKIFNREKVFQLREKGLSTRAIAAALGVGKGTIAREIKQGRRW
jgi:DNA invertase Pin-like site-specific DNA recombinase